MMRFIGWALLFCGLASMVGGAERPPVLVAFEDNDTLEEIRAKIAYNGYEFTVASNRIFNMSPAQKLAFFSRRAPTFPRSAIEEMDIGPLAQLLADPPTETFFAWTNYNGHTYIGAIRDQGDCGSCYSFGACATAEGVYNVAMGRYDANCVDFSESYIAWCLGRIAPYSDHFFGCDGADYDYYELEALVKTGVTYEANFPYQETDPGSCTHWGDPKIRFSSWHRAPCLDINAIKTAIRNFGVVDAAVAVSSAFEAYESGVYSDSATTCPGSPCQDTETDHAISLIGWNDNGDAANNGYWILRNSWNTDWGEKGYMRIKYTSARVACSVAYLVYSNAAAVAPTVATLAPTGISSNSAWLRGTVNPNSQASRYWFEYGLTTAYGTTTTITSAGSGSSAVAVSNRPTLSPATVYHYRVVATNLTGKSLGSDVVFTTLTAAATAPAVITVSAAGIASNAAWLCGSVNPNGRACNYWFEYGLTTSYGTTTTVTSAGAGSSVVAVSNRVTGLAPLTTYHYRVVATNSAGRSNGGDIPFTTLSALPAPPVAISGDAANISSNRATLQGQVNPNGVASQWRFQYGTSAAMTQATAWTAAGSGSALVSCSTNVTGLIPATLYYFRIVATNAGGATNATSRTFTTTSGASDQTLLFEGFEHAGAAPSGWAESGDSYWEYLPSNTYYVGHPGAPYAGSYMAEFFMDDYGVINQLITPAINFTGYTNSPTLTFWHFMEVWEGDQDILRVKYKTSSGGTPETLATYSSSVATWTKRTLALPNVNSTYYLIFEAEGNYGGGVCIDNVEVRGQASAAPATPDWVDGPINGPAPGQLILRWSSRTGYNYIIRASTNIAAGFPVLQSNIVATPSVNAYTTSVGTTGQRFYSVEEYTP